MSIFSSFFCILKQADVLIDGEAAENHSLHSLSSISRLYLLTAKRFVSDTSIAGAENLFCTPVLKVKFIFIIQIPKQNAAF